MSNKTNSVISVGDGRGFIVELPHNPILGRLVITAAHCLPHLPPAHRASYVEERTYRALLGGIDEQPMVWCECLFADPVADLAVLSAPDNQALSAEADAYEQLLEPVEPFTIGTIPLKRRQGPLPVCLHQVVGETDAFMLSLDGRWFPCHVRSNGQALTVVSQEEATCAGMSGSPIIDVADHAIGVVTIGGGDWSEPELASGLPMWMLRGPLK
jgi:hypothetical protein